MFTLKTNFEEEETEGEKQMKLRLEKKKKLINSLEQQFSLIENQKDSLMEAQLLTQSNKISGGVSKDYLLVEGREEGFDKNKALQNFLDEFRDQNILKEKAVSKYTTNHKSAVLENTVNKGEDKESLLKRQSELEVQIEEMRMRIVHQEQECERILAKEKSLHKDKLIIQTDIENVQGNLVYLGKLGKQQDDITHSKYRDVEKAVQRARIDLAQERVAKDLIISELERKLADWKTNTIKQVLDSLVRLARLRVI